MTQHSDRLWGGRFKTGPSAALTALSRPAPSVVRRAPYALAGSRAHAQELRRAEILTADELLQLLSEMDRLEAQFLAGEVGPTLDDEDVHTFLERELTQRLGTTGGKLRAGRSRNDQAANDLRPFLRDKARPLTQAGIVLQDELIEQRNDTCPS